MLYYKDHAILFYL